MRNALKSAAHSVRRFALLNARRLSGTGVVNHQGVKIAIGDHLSPTVAYYILNGDYERRECRGIRALLRPDDVVMELGAGIGFISLFCSKIVGDERVHAFEANPALEPLIRRNYDLNERHPTLEMCILGEVEGWAEFFISKDLWESSMIRPNPEAKAMTVPVRSLNETIRRIGPTFLIMDIEGAEYDIIKAIDFQTIRKVAFETHASIIGDDKIRFVERKLVESGFVIDRRFTKGQQLVATRP